MGDDAPRKGREERRSPFALGVSKCVSLVGGGKVKTDVFVVAVALIVALLISVKPLYSQQVRPASLEARTESLFYENN